MRPAARKTIAALATAKIANRAALNGSSTLVLWSAPARAPTAAANMIAGTATGMSLRRAGREPATSRAAHMAMSPAAAAAVNQRSAVPAARASDGRGRTRKMLTLQFARQLGSR
jgi:hypothetical protein